MSSPFYKKAISIIKKVPKGKVATYSQIARLSENPKGVRAVAWFLNSSSEKYSLPWHRIINSKGKISLGVGAGYFRQRELLELEGVEFDKNDKIDLSKYQWKKGIQLKKS